MPVVPGPEAAGAGVQAGGGSFGHSGASAIR